MSGRGNNDPTVGAGGHLNEAMSKFFSSRAQLKEYPSFKDAGPMVKIIIGSGEGKKEYLVYRNFATYHSPVFDKAFNGNFLEAETQVYNLVDFDFPGIFGLILQWMYSRYFHEDRGVNSISMEDLCRVWVLGDRLLMPEMQDSTVSALCYCKFGDDLKNNLLPVATWIYEETSPESPLRRLFAYRCAYELEWENGMGPGAYDLPTELISGIASIYQRDALKCKKVHRDWTNSDPWGGNKCACQFSNMLNPNDYRIHPREDHGW